MDFVPLQEDVLVFVWVRVLGFIHKDTSWQ